MIWLAYILAWLFIGEAIACFLAFIIASLFSGKTGRFAWITAGLAVALWPVAVFFACLYALAIPVRTVHQRINQPKLRRVA